MMKIKDVIVELERFAPVSLQEDYDNCGLLVGSADWEARGALLTLDCTEQVIDEAMRYQCNLIIAHHPLIFSGLKKLSGDSYVERAIVKAIKNDVAVYACHTNLDNVQAGVNYKIATKLGLTKTAILLPKQNELKKIVTYVPESHRTQVLDAMFGAGAGQIGNYDRCSFRLEGTGTFRGNENTHPFAGVPLKLQEENESRLETVVPAHALKAVVNALLSAHPYEEVAYDVYSLDNAHPQAGSGMTGELPEPLDEKEFLSLLKKTFDVPFLKHTALRHKKVAKIAVCGGSGRFLLKHAIRAGADAYVTADFKYHEYFDADGRILLADIGHYETERFTPELFSEIISKKFSTFAVRLSETNTNPVNYF